MSRNIVWSRFVAVCMDCSRRFRVGKDAIAESRAALGVEESAGFSDKDIAKGIDFCLECSGGLHDTGEFIEKNRLARRWDPKGWALDTLARMAGAVRQLEIATARQTLHPATMQRLMRRLGRCAALGDALRDRIDARS